jgi:hypothetical protein
MKFNSGDEIVHDVYGAGTVQVAGINGVCTVVFKNGSVKVVKTSDLHKRFKVANNKLSQ